MLRLTTSDVADEIVRTQPFPIGDLLDAGYDSDELQETVRSCTQAAWEDVDGIGGSLRVLGDVLFARNDEKVLLKVAALLFALRQHGRRTYVFDDPQHFAIRNKLDANVSVDVSNAPLLQVIADLANGSEIDIRLESDALREEKVREREPVSVTLSEQPLRTVLSAVLSPLGLGWILRDRVLWGTTDAEVADAKKAAVYDVRDLCRDESERDALQDALSDQTGISDAISFPRPGTMVILTTETEHDEILQLLEAYRVALRQSKRRERPGEGPDAIITRYYRLQSRIADDLARALPTLVRPETWKNQDRPNAQGTIRQLASGAALLDASGKAVVAGATDDAKPGSALVVEHAVLIIQQSRAAHVEIAELIEKIEHGDQPEGFGGGFGGGGFGGGLFSRPNPTQP